MNKHTQGPWQFEKDSNKVIANKTKKIGPNPKICTVLMNRKSSEANALLISAAPELLDALCNLIYWVNPDGSIPDNLTVREAISEARAAIAKATGDEK